MKGPIKPDAIWTEQKQRKKQTAATYVVTGETEKKTEKKSEFMVQMEPAVAQGSLNDNEWEGSGCRVGGGSVWEAMNDKVLHGGLAWRERGEEREKWAW